MTLNRAEIRSLEEFSNATTRLEQELIPSTNRSIKCEEALREEALRESSLKIRLTLSVHKSFHKSRRGTVCNLFFFFLKKMITVVLTVLIIDSCIKNSCNIHPP